ncbi:hypothetical protein SCYAM73S_03739 [Streptomyces cyaneofuscatus]
MEGAVAPPDERGHPGLLRLLRQQRTGRMLTRGSRLHIEPGVREPRQLDRIRGDLTCHRIHLTDQRTVLVVGRRAVGHGEDGSVLHLPGPGVPDGPLVGGGRRETCLRQVVAVGEARQDEGGIDRGDHIGDLEAARPVDRDDLGHRLRLHGVPELQDGQPGQPAVRQPLQLGDQVLPQRAARAVVDQGCLAGGQLPGGVPQGAAYGSVGRRGQVVVERDAVRNPGEQRLHHLVPHLRVQPADDDDGQFAPLFLRHRASPRPYRRSKRSTRPAVSRTRAVPV